jgi:hypothetical protein
MLVYIRQQNCPTGSCIYIRSFIGTQNCYSLSRLSIHSHGSHAGIIGARKLKKITGVAFSDTMLKPILSIGSVVSRGLTNSEATRM